MKLIDDVYQLKLSSEEPDPVNILRILNGDYYEELNIVVKPIPVQPKVPEVPITAEPPEVQEEREIPKYTGAMVKVDSTSLLPRSSNITLEEFPLGVSQCIARAVQPW